MPITTKLLKDTLKKANNDIRTTKALLTIEGFKDTDINEALKEAGLLKKKKPFTELYYSFLADKKRTVKEIEDFINGVKGYEDTSENTKRHISAYRNIGNLSITIFNNLEKGAK